MDFELAHFPVRSLSWGANTEYREGELIVNPRGAARRIADGSRSSTTWS